MVWLCTKVSTFRFSKVFGVKKHNNSEMLTAMSVVFHRHQCETFGCAWLGTIKRYLARSMFRENFAVRLVSCACNASKVPTWLIRPFTIQKCANLSLSRQFHSLAICALLLSPTDCNASLGSFYQAICALLCLYRQLTATLL